MTANNPNNGRQSLLEIAFRERSIKLDQFPYLFAMEAHTGACGTLFIGGWLYFVTQKYPAVASSLLAYAFWIGLAFFILMWLSIAPLTGQFARRLRGEEALDAGDLERLEVIARLCIVLLSAGYAVTCALLIWLTGGARSPFVPFYVMTFTLTITKVKDLYWLAVVLVFFLGAITIACSAAAYAPPHLDGMELKTVLEGEFQTVVHYVFIALSLGVPTLSAYLVEIQRHRLNKQPARGA